VSESQNLASWARAVLGHPQLRVEGAWPRAVALLGRQSLEASLDGFWQRTLPAMSGASRATQLACLDQYLRDHELTRGVRVAWSALSRACHHHAYELAPTAPELDHWLTSVEHLVEKLNEAEPA
jgi:hypothetical protein